MITVRRILQLAKANAEKRKQQLRSKEGRSQLEEEARQRRKQPPDTKQLKG